MQNRVKEFIEKNGLACSETARYLDLISEVGELGKEILKSTNYGQQAYVRRDGAEEEMGDCLFALLALCSALDIDAEAALTRVLDKYSRRLDVAGTVSSGR